MKVLVQWTRRNPKDWEELDSADWPTQPSRPVPTALGGKDNTPGWVLALSVQGVVFTGHDHYAVEDIPGGCTVTTWDDDPADPQPAPYIASRWTFLDPAPDMRYGGQVNTHQSVEYWHTEPVEGAGSGGPHRTHDPVSFVPPAHARHGVWVTDAKLAEHDAKRSVRSWREWIKP